MRCLLLCSCLALAISASQGSAAESAPLAAADFSADIVIVGGTPAGIAAALTANRLGYRSVLLERSAHVGGLPANGLGRTDISTRGASLGLFAEFIGRIRNHYVVTYGEESQQVRDCSDGYAFEPSVAERMFGQMLAEASARVTVHKLRQFDARPENVVVTGGTLRAITVLNRETGALERYTARVFIDATYEGDLAAAAGVPFRVGRESRAEFNEPMAGILYFHYEPRYIGTTPGLGTTGEGDNAVQAYNYRLCLTADPANRVAIPKPANYNRAEYASLIEDIRLDRSTQFPCGTPSSEWDGMGRVVTLGMVPNGKTDANHQASGFLSTDLAEENWPWPTSSWAWRDQYATRLRDYTLGLLWFIQNDPEVPEEMRNRASRWGLARDEYVDNGHFPRQPYVREGRRIEGEYRFTAHDAIPSDGVAGKLRPPVHPDSIASSHYHLDSHATRKREPDRIALEGFFSLKGMQPYTVPFGVIVPRKVDQLLVPVAASATHIGLSTLRMEPCWIVLGEAAGAAAALSIQDGRNVRAIDVPELQSTLVKGGSLLIYFRDAKPGDAHFRALQFFALRKFTGLDNWYARLHEPMESRVAAQWTAEAGLPAQKATEATNRTRGEFLDVLYEAVSSSH